MPPFVIGSLVASTMILVGIFYGVTLRRERRRHIQVMAMCGVCDVLLVVAIVLFRNAVPTAMEAEGMVLKIHLAFSVPALLGWFTALVSGLQRRRGRWVVFHRWNAAVFIVCRTGNWVTSFFVF